jgi:hypothetical protein
MNAMPPEIMLLSVKYPKMGRKLKTVESDFLGALGSEPFCNILTPLKI